MIFESTINLATIVLFACLFLSPSQLENQPGNQPETSIKEGIYRRNIIAECKIECWQRTSKKDYQKSIERATKEIEKNIDINDLINSLNNPFSSTKDTDSWIIETEANLLGVSLTQSRVGSRNSHVTADTCNDFLSGKPGKSTLLVEISAVKQYIIKKGRSVGKPMAFIGVEDETGQLDAVVFAEPYEKYQNLLYEQNTVVLYGYRSKQDSFVVDKVLQI